MNRSDTDSPLATELLGTPADATLPPLVRRALDVNWGAHASGSSGAQWNSTEMWAALQARREVRGRDGAPQVPVGVGRVALSTTSRTGEPTIPSRGRQSQIVRYGVAMAAMAVLAVSTLRIVSTHVTSAPSEVSMKEYRTAAGQRARVTLPDGSTVVLAPQSRLRYAVNFGVSTSRTITLDGHALFTVVHTTGTPFEVRTGSVTTRVLGTTFTVRRYQGDTSVKVVVAQGRVGVGSAVLADGDVAVVGRDAQVNISRDKALKNELAWAEGRLIFWNVPLRDVLPEIERWYGITIQVDPTMLSKTVLLTLHKESPDEAVHELAFAVDGRVELQGPHAVIRSR